MKKLGLAIVAIFAVVVAVPSFAVAATTDLSTSGSILAPYWQAGSGTGTTSPYTFIAITNPSISTVTGGGAHASNDRGMTVRAVNTSGVSAGVTATFTVSSGSIVKVFIAATNHGTVNSLKQTTAKFISTSGSGSVIISPSTLSGNVNGEAGGLSVWGVVYFPSTSSGFAMEFLGDLGNSALAM